MRAPEARATRSILAQRPRCRSTASGGTGKRLPRSRRNDSRQCTKRPACDGSQAMPRRTRRQLLRCCRDEHRAFRCGSGSRHPMDDVLRRPSAARARHWYRAVPYASHRGSCLFSPAEATYRQAALIIRLPVIGIGVECSIQPDQGLGRATFLKLQPRAQGQQSGMLGSFCNRRV